MPLDSGIREAILHGRAPAPSELDDLVAGEAVRLGAAGAGEVRAALGAALLGSGPLEPLLQDPLVTDVLVNGDGSVWVDRGAGLERAALEPLGAETTRLLAVRLAGQAGRRLDESRPWVDGLLPGGVRLHAVLPPLVEGGAHLSLRVPRRALRRLDDLQAAGLFDAETGDLLRRLVERRVSFLVTGGTGSGKTTLLGALLAQVPDDERVVVVEDVRELSVAHPHVVRLQSRSANVEGAGEVTLVDLVRQALRMRPDRLVVGEVRGAEVRELLSALNTGHDGGGGTVHANSPADVVPRFEALGALAGLGREAVQAQLASAVQVVVHLRRERVGRRIASISVLERPGSFGGFGGFGGVTGLEVAVGVECRSRSGEGNLRGPGWPRLAGLLGVSA
jgi:pilus assembly protein CpaF